MSYSLLANLVDGVLKLLGDAIGGVVELLRQFNARWKNLGQKLGLRPGGSLQPGARNLHLLLMAWGT
jgi:hypothetical protein